MQHPFLFPRLPRGQAESIVGLSSFDNYFKGQIQEKNAQIAIADIRDTNNCGLVQPGEHSVIVNWNGDQQHPRVKMELT